MRIIGGRDYYDSAMAYGRDDKVVFVRKGREFADKVVPFSVLDLPFNVWLKKGEKGRTRIPMLGYARAYRYTPAPGRFWQFDGVALVICGVLWRGIRLRDEKDQALTEHFFWLPDAFDAWLRQENAVLTWHWNRRDATFAAVLGQQAPISRAQMDWIVGNGVVTALALAERDGTTWAINSDGLKDVGFFRILDPWSAWQEISMFVGGVLPAHGNTMVAIDDRVRLEKHGFDAVRSFRNMERV